MTTPAPAANAEARILAVIRTEPALLMTLLQVALAVVASLGLHLSAHQAGAVLGLGAAVLAVIPAALARPVKVSAFSGLIAAGVTVLAAFGVHGITPGTVAALSALLAAGMGTVLRVHLTPAANLPPAEPAKL